MAVLREILHTSFFQFILHFLLHNLTQFVISVDLVDGAFVTFTPLCQSSVIITCSCTSLNCKL